MTKTLFSEVYLSPQSRPDGYLARFCQNLAKTAYLERSDRKMVILRDLAEKWLSCKILASSYWLSFMQHISFRPEIYLRISCVFFKKKINLNKF